MIVDALISLALNIISFIVNFFPSSAGFPAEVNEAINFIGSYVGIIDPLVPISTLLSVLSLILAFELIIFGYKGFKWAFAHLPFVSSR